MSDKKLLTYSRKKVMVGFISCTLTLCVAPNLSQSMRLLTSVQAQTQNVSQQTLDEFKAIQFSDEILANSLGVEVSIIKDNVMVKAIQLATSEGKKWAQISQNEKDSYQKKATDQIRATKMQYNPFKNAFDRIKQDLGTYINKYQISSTYEDQIKNNKQHFVMGLAYFETLYNIKVNDTETLKDILFKKVDTQTLVNNLITIGKEKETNLSYLNNVVFYQNKIAQLFHSDATLNDFIKANVSNANEWFEKSLNIIHYIAPEVKNNIFDKMMKDYSNHVLPLLSLGKESVYMIANEASITYGLYDTYVTPNAVDKAQEEQTFIEKIKEVGDAQRAHINLWKELSDGRAPKLATIVKDAYRIKSDDENPYISQPQYTAERTWATQYQTEGLQQFITPLNLYSTYQRIGAIAEKPNIRLLMARALQDNGLSAYTHELIHLYVNEYLNGNQRTDTKAELLPRGLFESYENDEAYFGLNLIYKNRKYTNTSYEQFKSVDEDIKTYMKNQMDLIYSLEIIEGQEILKRSDKLNFFKQLTQANDANSTQTIDTFNPVTNLTIQTINDLVDNNLVVSRYYVGDVLNSNQAKNNGYHSIPLFSSFFAAPNNENGAVGDVSLRRIAFEIMAEYGYKKGTAPYLSNQYTTENEAINGISSGAYTTLSNFKKEMYANREQNLSRLNDVSFSYNNNTYTTADISTLMQQALEIDSRNVNDYQNSEVEKLKNSIFLAYKAQTNDFTTTIYKEEQVVESRKIYVKNGDLTSQDGLGTQETPYDSLTYALSKAKAGDTIILTQNVTYTGNSNLVIDKDVTIDGNNYALTFRGLDLDLQNNVVFKNINLAFMTDGNADDGKIYVNDYHVTFDNVNTKLGSHPTQDNIRPILIAGSQNNSTTSDRNALITIVNSTSETRFKSIVLGNEAGEKVTNTTLDISANTKVDKDVVLSSLDNTKTTGKVTINTASNTIKQFKGGFNAEDSVLNILDSTNIYGLNVDKIGTLTIGDRSNVSLLDEQNNSITLDNVVINANATLSLDTRPHTMVNNIQIDGTLRFNPLQNKMTVNDQIKGQGEISFLLGTGTIPEELINVELIQTVVPQIKTVRTSFMPETTKYIIQKTADGYQISEKDENIQENVVDLPFDVEYIADETLAFNQREVTPGVNGKHITRIQNGVTIFEQTIPAQNQIVRIGNKKIEEREVDFAIRRVYNKSILKTLGDVLKSRGVKGLDSIVTVYSVDSSGNLVSPVETIMHTKLPQEEIYEYGDAIEWTPLEEPIVTTTENIDFDIVYQVDNTLPFGEQREVTPGVLGQKTIKKRGDKIISSEITTSAENKIIAVGNKKVFTQSIPFNIIKEADINRSELDPEEIVQVGEEGLIELTQLFEVNAQTGQLTLVSENKVILKNSKDQKVIYGTKKEEQENTDELDENNSTLPENNNRDNTSENAPSDNMSGTNNVEVNSAKDTVNKNKQISPSNKDEQSTVEQNVVVADETNQTQETTVVQSVESTTNSIVVNKEQKENKNSNLFNYIIAGLSAIVASFFFFFIAKKRKKKEDE